MIYNSIEEELWRIFTFYALHSDPTQPEVLKPANFIKFCKDCQITSKKFTTSSVELEIARLVSCGCVLIYFTCPSLCRFFRNVQARMKSQGVDYILSNAINFIDFMQLLEMVSVKVIDTGKVACYSFYLQLHQLTRFKYNTTPQIYPRDSPEVAAKRLVLENVLLLAHRRTPLNDYFDLENVEVPLCCSPLSCSQRFFCLLGSCE